MATRRTKALLQIWDTSGEEQAGEGTAPQWKSVYTDRLNNKNALFQYQQKDRLGQSQTCKMSLLNPSIASTQAMLVNEYVDASEDNILVDNVTGGGYPSSQAPTNSYISIDDEIMKVTGYSSTSLTVERGALGTIKAVHDNNTPVIRDPRGGTRGYVENTYDNDLKQLSRIRVIDSITKAVMFVGRIYSMHIRQDMLYGSVIELAAFDALRELSDNRLRGKNADFSDKGSEGVAAPKVSDIITRIIKHFTYNTVSGTNFTPVNISTADTLKFNESVASTTGSPNYSRGNHTGLSAISRESLSDPHSASTSDTTPASEFGYSYYIDSNFTSALKTADPTTYPAALNYFKRESLPEVAANIFYTVTSKGKNTVGSLANTYTTTAVTMSDFDMTRTHSDVITDLSVTISSTNIDPFVLNCIAFNVSNLIGPDSGSFSYTDLFNGKTIEESPKVFIDAPGSTDITPVYVGKLIYMTANSGDAIAVIALDGTTSTIAPASLLYGRSGTYSSAIGTQLLFVPFEESGEQTTATTVDTAVTANTDAYSRVRANATTSTTYELRRMSTATYDANTRVGTGAVRRAIGSHFIARDGLNTPRRGSLHLSEFPMAQMRFDLSDTENAEITIPSGAGHPDTRGIRKGMVVRQLDADGAETGKFGYISGVADGSYDVDVTLYNVSTENEGGTHVAQATTNWADTDQADIYVPIRAGHMIYITNPYLHIGGEALITEVDYDEGPGLQTTTMKYVMDNPAALIVPIRPAPMITTLDTSGAGITSRASSARVVPNSGTTVFTKGSYRQVNWPLQKFYIGSERYDISVGNSTTANGGSYISNSEWSAVYFEPASEGGSDTAYNVDTVANIRANSGGTAIIVAKIRASTSTTGDPEWEPQVSMPQGAQYDLTGSDVFGGTMPSSLFTDGNKSFTSDLEWTGVSNTEVGWSNGSSGNGTVTLSDGTALTITKSTNGSGVGYGLTTNTYYFYVQALDGAGTYSMAKSTTAADASGDAKILLATVGVDTSLDVKPVILPYNSKKPSISAVSIQADGIIADSIAALAITSKHTITGATIQTSASASADRVVITSTGIDVIASASSSSVLDIFHRVSSTATKVGRIYSLANMWVLAASNNADPPTIASRITIPAHGQTTGGHAAQVMFDGVAEFNGTSFFDDTLTIGTSKNIVPESSGDSSLGTSLLKFNTVYGQEILAGVGTDVDPSIAFYDDPDTGIARDAADTLALVAGGEALNIKIATQTSDSAHYMGIYPNNEGDANASDGSDGRPWVNIGSYPTTATGWNYRFFNAIIGYYLQAGDGTNSYPGFAFKDDPNTGFYRIASGRVGFSGDSTKHVEFGAANLGTHSSSLYNSGATEFVAGVYYDGYSAGSTAHTLSLNASTNLILRSTSSIRYKKDVQEINSLVDSEKIWLLEPKAFKWKEDTGTPNVQDAGLIAEEVEKISPKLVEYNDTGQPEAVKYSYIPLLMLEEMKKLRNRIQQLEEKS